MIECHRQTTNRTSDIAQLLAAAADLFVLPSIIVLHVSRGFQWDKILKRFAALDGNRWRIVIT